MDWNIASVFKNGGPNYSFGRVFAGLTVLMGLVVLSVAIYGDYQHPTKPVIMTHYDRSIKNTYQETVLVAEPNWAGYQTFLLGISALAGSIYGLGKISDTAAKWSKNPSGEGGGGLNNEPDPKPPQEV